MEYIVSRPNMCPLRVTIIFKTFKNSSGIYSKLPTKHHKGGGLSTFEIPILMEGDTLKHQTFTDLQLIQKDILQPHICHFKQTENNPLARKDVINSIGFGASTSTAAGGTLNLLNCFI